MESGARLATSEGRLHSLQDLMRQLLTAAQGVVPPPPPEQPPQDGKKSPGWLHIWQVLLVWLHHMHE